MELFDSPVDETINLLPQDGVVNYYGRIFDNPASDRFFSLLLHHIEWRNDEAAIFGRKIITSRKVAWYGSRPFEYTYSNITKTALPWTGTLLELKSHVEERTGETFNSCLLNLYHHGGEGMAWHSDGEADLRKDGAIASLSFGAERKFAFKHKLTGAKVERVLAHGSLLVMKGTTQTYWLHRLPVTRRVHTPRINLTFRTIEE